MNGKQLKNSILQWAIQGKLVPQDPNDEPASVLLERIRQEKERLIKEKKIKRDKNASIIYRGEDNSYYEKFLATGEVKCIDDEIPFEIPRGWEWCRMGCIGDWGAGATPAKSNTSYYGGNILWLRTGELNNGIVNDTEIKITDKALNECSLRLNKAGDVLIAMYGATIGKVAIAGCELTTNQACCACTPIGIFNYYLFYFLMGSQVDFIKKGEGGAQPNISREKLVAHLMPIPPIQEQHRIVERIKDVLPLTDKYVLSQIALDELNRSINDKLKKSILQEAIQGKLVPQIEKEGTAQELLEQIRQEKLKLVQEGKLKKAALNDSIIYKGDDNKYWEKNGKTEKDITEEIPFEIPDSWAWVRLSSISDIIGGYAFQSSSLKEKQGKRVIRISDFSEQGFVNTKIVRYDGTPISDIYKLRRFDILMAMTGGTVGKSLFIRELPETEILLNQRVARIRSLWINVDYLYFVIIAPHVKEFICKQKNSTNDNISMTDISNFIIPLPPIKEQIRIVKKLYNLASIMRG